MTAFQGQYHFVVEDARAFEVLTERGARSPLAHPCAAGRGCAPAISPHAAPYYKSSMMYLPADGMF